MSHPKVSPEVWKDFLAQHGDGGVLNGVVASVVPFGAFVEVGPGIHGLLPSSACPEKLETGASIPVRITNIDPQNRRMSLALA
jgi:small subunit ribosomal protein S1